MEHGLLDELRLWLHPFFVGKEGPDGLIYREGGAARFELKDTIPDRGAHLRGVRP